MFGSLTTNLWLTERPTFLESTFFWIVRFIDAILLDMWHILCYHLLWIEMTNMTCHTRAFRKQKKYGPYISHSHYR